MGLSLLSVSECILFLAFTDTSDACGKTRLLLTIKLYFGEENLSQRSILSPMCWAQGHFLGYTPLCGTALNIITHLVVVPIFQFI